MADDKLNQPNVNSVEYPVSSPSDSNEVSGRISRNWPLSTLMSWILGPVACVVVANSIVGGFTYRPLPVTTIVWTGTTTAGLLFLFVFLPLWWTFTATGIRFASRVSVILVASFLCMCLFSPRFILSAWASILVASAFIPLFRAWHRMPQFRSGAIWASATMLTTVGLHTLSMELWPSFELQRLQVMRAEYPLVNIADRIENRVRRSEDSIRLSLEGSQMQRRLQTAYDQHSARPFFNSLKLVHDAQFERFVRAPGFGPVRLNPRLIRYWAKPTFSAATQSDTPNQHRSSYDSDHRSTFYVLSADPSEAAQQLSPTDSHVWTFWDFLHPTTFGSAVRQQEVVGFRAHSVTYRPAVLYDSERFDMEKLELIGLLTHDGPIVYQTDGLPDMESIVAGEIATRQLNRFELEGLDRLRTGETLVIQREGQSLKMVGALRAIEQCAECHQARAGDLLGAFSYIFRAND